MVISGLCHCNFSIIFWGGHSFADASHIMLVTYQSTLHNPRKGYRLLSPAHDNSIELWKTLLLQHIVTDQCGNCTSHADQLRELLLRQCHEVHVQQHEIEQNPWNEQLKVCCSHTWANGVMCTVCWCIVKVRKSTSVRTCRSLLCSIVHSNIILFSSISSALVLQTNFLVGLCVKIQRVEWNSHKNEFYNTVDQNTNFIYLAISSLHTDLVCYTTRQYTYWYMVIIISLSRYMALIIHRTLDIALCTNKFKQYENIIQIPNQVDKNRRRTTHLDVITERQ